MYKQCSRRNFAFAFIVSVSVFTLILTVFLGVIELGRQPDARQAAWHSPSNTDSIISSTSHAIYNLSAVVPSANASNVDLVAKLSRIKCGSGRKTITWWHNSFNRNWFTIHEPSLSPLYNHHNHNELSSLQCSMSGQQMRMCIARNVYAQRGADGLLRFQLRCHDCTESEVRGISEKLAKVSAKDGMNDNTLNRVRTDFVVVSDRLDSKQFDAYGGDDGGVYYYSNALSEWCSGFAGATNYFRGNPWHCMSFIAQVVGAEIVLKHYRSRQKPIYVTGSNIMAYTANASQSEHLMVPQLMRPFFSDILVQTAHTQQPNHYGNRFFIRELVVLPHASLSFLWDSHDNWKHCKDDASSPLLAALNIFFEDAYGAILAQKHDAFVDEFLYSPYFEVYNAGERIQRSSANHSRLYDTFGDNTAGINVIYVSSRWAGPIANNGTSRKCLKRCIKNIDTLKMRIVQKYNDGIVVFGNALYLSFEAQLVLFKSINGYIGCHGAGFSMTIFMQPIGPGRDQRKYFVFEIIPAEKKAKGRTAEHFARYSGLCYSSTAVQSETNIAINVNQTMLAVDKLIQRCSNGNE